jgi:hypothetical protein
VDRARRGISRYPRSRMVVTVARRRGQRRSSPQHLRRLKRRSARGRERSSPPGSMLRRLAQPPVAKRGLAPGHRIAVELTVNGANLMAIPLPDRAGGHHQVPGTAGMALGRARRRLSGMEAMPSWGATQSDVRQLSKAASAVRLSGGGPARPRSGRPGGKAADLLSDDRAHEGGGHHLADGAGGGHDRRVIAPEGLFAGAPGGRIAGLGAEAAVGIARAAPTIERGEQDAGALHQRISGRIGPIDRGQDGYRGRDSWVGGESASSPSQGALELSIPRPAESFRPSQSRERGVCEQDSGRR